jgi:hypothetical protein
MRLCRRQTIREKPADVLVSKLDRLKASALCNSREMLSQQIDCVIASIGALDNGPVFLPETRSRKGISYAVLADNGNGPADPKPDWVSESADKPIEWNMGDAAGGKPSFDLY